jgi:opacity protein-like surface antigen
MKKAVACAAMVSLALIAHTGFTLDAIEIYSGFFEAELKNQDDYQGIPLLVSLDFDLKDAFSKIGVNTKGRIDFVLEPFANTIISPEANVEVGSNFLIKYVFPLTDTVQPYFKGGLGALYMSQKTEEQGTQYNFLPQAGVGVHLFLNNTTALSCEYRYRHLSNNSFDDRNGGIDAYMSLMGISFFFE